MGVLLGNGDGTFQTVVSYDAGGLSAESVAVDVNGDDKPDLVVANYLPSDAGGNASAGVLLGKGDGTFHAALEFDVTISDQIVGGQFPV